MPKVSVPNLGATDPGVSYDKSLVYDGILSFIRRPIRRSKRMGSSCMSDAARESSRV